MAGPHTEVVRVGSEELEAQVAKALTSTAQEAGTTESGVLLFKLRSASDSLG